MESGVIVVLGRMTDDCYGFYVQGSAPADLIGADCVTLFVGCYVGPAAYAMEAVIASKVKEHTPALHDLFAAHGAGQCSQERLLQQVRAEDAQAKLHAKG